jgi:hypothetical protein
VESKFESKTDPLVFAAKELLRNALQSNGVRILSHGFGADRGDVSFAIHDKYFYLSLELTEVPEKKMAPLRPARARRVLGVVK